MVDLSPLESDALVDKSVSQLELKEAGLALVECIQASGFNAGFEGSPKGPGQVVSVFAANGVDPTEDAAKQERMVAAYDSCESEVEAVTAVWGLQNQTLFHRALPGTERALAELEVAEE